MIYEYQHQRKTYKFIDRASNDYGQNVFTILVGKNGTGKSTLLGAISRSLLESVEPQLFYGDEELGFKKLSRGRLGIDGGIDKLIAVSTSPFDKFPVKRNLTEIENYSYLGLRGLHSTNFGLAYLSRIISSLVESVSNDQKQARHIASVLNYLGYSDEIRVSLSLATTTSKKSLIDFLEMEDPISIFHEPKKSPISSLNKRFFIDDTGNVDFEKVDKLKNIVIDLLDFGYPKGFDIIIHRNGLDHYPSRINSEWMFLIQSGLIRLKDVILRTLEGANTFSIKNASSGEQSVILSILGIASQIKDNSLICIDEPEVCLHPQWQEKYIQLLIRTFDRYRNCQFIIATHSPQIVSNLRSSNCYILSMENRKLRPALEFINNSSDFQLANVFEAPGHKNEYLSRIALNIFTKVSKRKRFDSEDKKNLKFLKYQSEFLDPKDPVLEIYISLMKMLEEYG